MNLTKILSVVFFLVAVALAYFLVSSIQDAIEEEKRIARIERRVIDKLKVIREAQIAFQSVHGRYTDDWSELLNFMKNGNLYIIERTEETKLLEYGAEETIVHIDTLGVVSVRDSLFNEKRYPNLNIDQLPFIPGSDENARFEMFADEIKKGNVNVDVVEVKDVDPVNPTRTEESPPNRKPLRFGSRTDVTTAGNWE